LPPTGGSKIPAERDGRCVRKGDGTYTRKKRVTLGYREWDED